MVLGSIKSIRRKAGKRPLEIARAEIPDLILTDIEMPGGMDGLEVTRILRSLPETKDCPIIILTGSGVAGYGKTEGMKAGATDYFAKPFSPLACKTTIYQRLKSDEMRTTVHAKKSIETRLSENGSLFSGGVPVRNNHLDLSNDDVEVLRCLGSALVPLLFSTSILQNAA